MTPSYGVSHSYSDDYLLQCQSVLKLCGTSGHRHLHKETGLSVMHASQLISNPVGEHWLCKHKHVHAIWVCIKRVFQFNNVALT
jgi:hypothetical protein